MSKWNEGISQSGRAKTCQRLVIPITGASTNCTGKRSDWEEPEATASWPIPIASSHSSKRSRRLQPLKGRGTFLRNDNSSRVDFVTSSINDRSRIVYRLERFPNDGCQISVEFFIAIVERIRIAKKSIHCSRNDISICFKAARGDTRRSGFIVKEFITEELRRGEEEQQRRTTDYVNFIVVASTFS